MINVEHAVDSSLFYVSPFVSSLSTLTASARSELALCGLASSFRKCARVFVRKKAEEEGGNKGKFLLSVGEKGQDSFVIVSDSARRRRYR